jgi:hypothetical protein
MTGGEITRVGLHFVRERDNVWLRFGRPLRVLVVSRERRVAEFVAGQVFARIRWQGNEYGKTLWQLLILQACRPGESLQRVEGIWPVAAILLRSSGAANVQGVLSLLDEIECQPIDLADVNPSYWRTAHSRLAARLPVPTYTAERHAAGKLREQLL